MHTKAQIHDHYYRKTLTMTPLRANLQKNVPYLAIKLLLSGVEGGIRAPGSWMPGER
jgi:hypothetical protein